jgi:hypothetical protein
MLEKSVSCSMILDTSFAIKRTMKSALFAKLTPQCARGLGIEYEALVVTATSSIIFLCQDNDRGSSEGKAIFIDKHRQSGFCIPPRKSELLNRRCRLLSDSLDDHADFSSFFVCFHFPHGK